MSVAYENVYKLFYNRIVNDTDFFTYVDITPTEAKEIALQRSKDLLITSVNKLYEFGKPDIDFYDRDDTIEVFNCNINLKEQDLLSSIMFIKYLELDVIKLKVQTTIFSNKDLKLLGDNNQRKTFMDMFNNREEKMEKSIKTYFSRDRQTNKYKKLDYSNFYNS
jgi:hypothetical protein